MNAKFIAFFMSFFTEPYTRRPLQWLGLALLSLYRLLGKVHNQQFHQLLANADVERGGRLLVLILSQVRCYVF